MTIWSRHRRLLSVASLVFFLISQQVVQACPNCGDSLASDPAQAGLVRGLFWSILFLLSMPFLITAGMGAYFYWQIRTARRAAASTPQPESVVNQGPQPSHPAERLETAAL